MTTFLTAFLIAFGYVVVVTPVLIYLGKKYGFVDNINRRTIHSGRIPRIGGIGISTGMIFPLLLLLLYHNSFSEMFFQTLDNTIVVIGGGLAISILGLVDDIKGVAARYKFLFQILVAIAAYFLGFAIQSISTPWGAINFGFLALPITVLWIVGIINAFNLIDGMDGLSSGIAFFVSLTLFILAIHNNVLFVALITACLGGAVVGFLIYNFNPAKIFMGDAGSMFIGYILAVLSLKGASKDSAIVSLLIPMMAMGIPILDTTLAFMRRRLRNQPIFLADRQHIHHILLSKGFNQRRVVLILYSISLLFTGLALVSIFMKDTDVFLIITVFSVIIVVIITKLGYMNIVLNKYINRKNEPMEKLLSSAIIRNMASLPLRDMERLIYSLPVKGFSLLHADGTVFFESGASDSTNFLDVMTDKHHCVRFFWKTVVPTINSRESQLLTIISRALFSYFHESISASQDSLG